MKRDNTNATPTVPQVLVSAAAQWPNRPWVRSPGGTASRAVVCERAGRSAGGLLRAGITPGDRVVLVAPNSIEFLVGWFSAMFVRAPVLSVNPRASSAELGAVAQTLQPRAIITRLEDMARVADTLLASAAKVSVLAIEELEDADFTEPLTTDAEEHVAFLQTSGTTGTPKFIIRTHAMYTLAAEAFPWWLGLMDRDVMLTALPLAHGNAQLYSALGSLGLGAELALLPSFSAATFWEDVVAYGATQFNAIGAMLEILMQRPPSKAERSHRVRLCYTAPAPSRQRHEAIEDRFGIHLVLGYSQSEAGGFGLITPLQGVPRYGSMGRPRQHPRLGEITSVRVVSSEGQPLQDGAVGELEIRNPTTTPGYLNRPEESAALRRDGWLRTGDLAWRDGDGYYFFGGRSKELIRHKGENLSPAEVENVLEHHPAVSAAAVVGVPSDLSEEDIKAFVILDQDSEVTAATLFEWCDARLPPYKTPRYIEVVGELPLTDNHKVAKACLPRDRTAGEVQRRSLIRNSQASGPNEEVGHG